jgi:hypothetical protein
MNGENNHVFHTRALDGHAAHDPPRFTWPLFAVQLWLHAAFVGMSLAVGAPALFIAGETESLAPTLALGALGAALAAFACRSIAHQLDRVERGAAGERAAADGPEALSAPKLALAPHR